MRYNRALLPDAERGWSNADALPSLDLAIDRNINGRGFTEHFKAAS
jgi:hypothetical protein